MRLSSLAQNEYFAQNPAPEIQRSRFDRSAGNKFDFSAGYLIPFYADEMLPGDTFEAKLDLFARFNTPIKPIMDNVYLDVHFFAVPLRLIWTNFKRFMGEQKNPGDSIDFITPKVTDLPSRSFQPYSPFDYMGLPTLTTGIFKYVTAFHSRAINLIWNEYYRDQNLNQSLPVQTDDGPDDLEANLYQILPRRNKRKDYFTSALPFAQKGNPVTIPAFTSLTNTITGTGTIALPTPTISKVVNSNLPSWQLYGTSTNVADGSAQFASGTIRSSASSSNTVVYNPNGTLVNSATSINASDVASKLTSSLTVNGLGTINMLREAFQLQRFLERDARGGSRYTETVWAHFHVESPDARQQRPEYLGGGTLNLNINPVTQTAPSVSGTTPQGNLSAFGTVSTQNQDIGFTYSSTEHQVLIGFISARADLSYQQGIPRMWSRNTKYDFFWPEFAHLGEQAIKQMELKAKNNDDTHNTLTFGYQERYSEYKYRQSIIAGALRSNYPQSLDSWHLAQEFDDTVTLGPNFIHENPPIARTVAVPSEKDFICDTFLHLYCTRPMPVNAIPGMADHF